MSENAQPHPVPELLAAVQAEIRAERRDDARNAVKVALVAGRFVSTSEAGSEYVFTCRKWDASLDGADVLVRAFTSRGPWTPATAARMPNGKVRLIVAEDLGQSVAGAEIRRDDSAGLVLIAQRLASVGQNGSTIRTASAGWIVGQGNPVIGRESRPERWIADWSSPRFNPQQRLAMAQALASEVLFLWGPPGTGKTDVLGHIVEGCVRQGLNVLFLAPTKVAVDQALQRVCDLLKGLDGFADGLVQRAGDIEVVSLRERYGDHVDTERIAARVSIGLEQGLVAARARRETARSQLALHDDARTLADAHVAARNAWVDAAKSYVAVEEERRYAEATCDGLLLDIRRIGTPSGVFAKRKQDRLDDLYRQLAEADERADDARRLAGDRDVFVRTCEATDADLGRRSEAAQRRLVGVSSHAALTRDVEEDARRIEALERQLRSIRDTVRSKCRVMGATVAKAVQSRRLLDRVDVVVIDEAGMVDLPSAWLAAGLAGKRLIVAGDFRQLPAVTKGAGDRHASDEERAFSERWAARDAFHAAGLVAGDGRVRQDARLVALNTQYRMRAPICALVNSVAYPDAPLTTGRDDFSGIPFNPLVDAPVMLVDTSRQRIPGPDYRANTVNEAVVHELIRGLQYEGVLPGRKWREADIAEGERAVDRLAIIAPYRAQVSALKGSLKHRFGQDYEGLVDTVHRFQGSQRPIVVLDTAVGAGRDPGWFYSGTGLSSHTCRLLNVALSRAQDHLIVVADVEHLRRHLPPGSEAGIMLDHLESRAQVLSADQLVPTREAAQLSALSEEELARPAFFPADEVHAAVKWDIARAVTGIDLYCPFLNPGPVRAWSALLRDRVDAGVRVRVHTRSPDEQRSTADARAHSQRIEELRAAGCVVDFRERMHEKVLILDGTVLWHGSFNLLASTGPTDLMMRYTDPATCERVSRVIARARKDGAARSPRTPAGDSGVDKGARATSRPASADGIGPGATADGCLYLDVPFGEKEEAKRLLGARWDAPRRLWYVDATRVTREQARRWLPAS